MATWVCRRRNILSPATTPSVRLLLHHARIATPIVDHRLQCAHYRPSNRGHSILRHPLLRFAPLHASTRPRRRLLSVRGESDKAPPISHPSNGEPAPSVSKDAAAKATPIVHTVDTVRSTSEAVRERVRSSLTNLSRSRENIYNLPNFLTVTRLFAAPATAYLLLHDHNHWALALFAYAGITDLVDGWLARRWKLQTVAGSVMDPMADKALMIILTVTLAFKGALPLYLATLILGRDASLALAAIYYRYASLPAPKTFVRYWDFSLPSAEVHPTTVSKYNTFLQLILIGSTLALPVVLTTNTPQPGLGSFSAEHVHTAMTYFQYVVAATTAWSGLSYAYLKDAVTILGSNEGLKAKQGARGRAIIGVTFGSMVLAAGYFLVAGEEKKRGDGEEAEAERITTR